MGVPMAQPGRRRYPSRAPGVGRVALKAQHPLLTKVKAIIKMMACNFARCLKASCWCTPSDL